MYVHFASESTDASREFLAMASPRHSEFRAQVLFGSSATYRVVEIADGHALVQAVDVPGIAPGTRMRVVRAAVEQMAVIERPALVAASPRFTRTAV